jgi:hypothetical protein
MQKCDQILFFCGADKIRTYFHDFKSPSQSRPQHQRSLTHDLQNKNWFRFLHVFLQALIPGEQPLLPDSLLVESQSGY